MGLQQASLYHHVSSKEDLLCEICRTALEELNAAAHASVDGATAPERCLEPLICALLRAELGHQKAHATMAFELRSISPNRQTPLRASLGQCRDLVRLTIVAAQDAGLLRADIDARDLVLSLVNLLSWVLLWYKADGAYSRDELTAHLLDLWLHGVAADRASARAAAPAPVANDHADRWTPPTMNPSARTADRVLDAAALLFRTKGYDATTAREIAATLGIQKASLYHHTRSKGRLLYEVCTKALQSIQRDVGTAVALAIDPIERARVLVGAHVDSLLRHQNQHATSLLELRALSGDDAAAVVALRDAYDAFVRSVIDEGRRSGAIRTDLPAGLLTQYLFSLTNRTMLWFRPQGPLAPDQLGMLFASLFLSGAARVPSADHI
jgi:AcrR family transcriptional regulator